MFVFNSETGVSLFGTVGVDYPKLDGQDVLNDKKQTKIKQKLESQANWFIYMYIDIYIYI